MKATTFLTFFALLFLTACGQAPSNTQDGITKDISVEEFLAMDMTNYHLVDVRTAEEFNEGNIEGSINIDWYGDSFMDKMDKLSKDKGIVVYCKSGGRSSNAMDKLSKNGYNEIYNIEGGYMKYSKSNK